MKKLVSAALVVTLFVSVFTLNVFATPSLDGEYSFVWPRVSAVIDNEWPAYDWFVSEAEGSNEPYVSLVLVAESLANSRLVFIPRGASLRLYGSDEIIQAEENTYVVFRNTFYTPDRTLHSYGGADIRTVENALFYVITSGNQIEEKRFDIYDSVTDRGAGPMIRVRDIAEIFGVEVEFVNTYSVRITGGSGARYSVQMPPSPAAQALERTRFQELFHEYITKIDALTTSLSDEYLADFHALLSEVAPFDSTKANALTEVAIRDIKVGDGPEITDGYSAYYIGWLADGTIFDSSLSHDQATLLFPIAGGENLIQGWKDGIAGMKIGGVREITMSSSLGYGPFGHGLIPASSPLRFVIMLIDPIEIPDPCDELLDLYVKYGF
ncbi:FKBP-type peptidyl-prolyl cis-trans isomerase [Candidatus Saccharibacteria bacterium]|nr:FKBP-type peptidyl-prolyl cis-trans isomerase [Candidatus Saccharibacteria bacterium]